MLRYCLLLGLGLAACEPVTVASLCEDGSDLAGCAIACDPAPGAASTCPSGFHCSPDGMCNAYCTPGGGECGDGYACSDDGRCYDNGPGGENGPDAACPAVNFAPTLITPSIELLIDRSGSMAESIGATSRYAAMRTALTDPTNGVVTRLQAKAYFGASLYSTDNPCPTLTNDTSGRSLNNRAAIDALLATHAPAGNTPTAGSITKAIAKFVAVPLPAGSPPVIVVATDGLPNNCDGNQAQGQVDAINAARAANAAGIRLFILGVGNGINDAHLQAMANAGAGVTVGQANAPYYLANSPQQLSAAFDQIIGSVSCDLMLSGSIDPTTAMNGTVTLNGMPLGYGVGWTMVNGNTIRLLGQACSTLQSSPNPSVSASFPCKTVIF